MSATRSPNARRNERRFVCEARGQSWRKHPATAVDCPHCQQPAGSLCLRPSGHEMPGGIPHIERERVAVDAGLFEMCPEGPTAKGLR